MRVSNWILMGATVMASSSILASSSAATATATAETVACSARSGSQVMPLVELYTSEGCSSCPPADRWLSRVYAMHEANFLAFHVDYWDSLGWADRFAQPAYSQRQRQRVNAAGERTVYTPQVMLGQQIQVNWRDAAEFSRLLASQRGQAMTTLSLQVESTAVGAKVTLEARPSSLSADASAEVWLAQYSDAQVTRVERGENGGETLQHDRVVVQLWGPWRLGGDPIIQTLRLQQAFSAGGLTAFAQDAHGRVWQSLSLTGADCAGAR